MSSTRFPWSRASKVDWAFELKNRNKKLTLDRDARILCGICGRKPKKDESVYLPSLTPNTQTNEVIAHAPCLDRYCAEQSAKSAHAARLKDAEKKGLLPLAVASAKSVKMKNGGGVELNADLIEQVQRTRSVVYRQGFEAGFAAALQQLAGGSDDEVPFSH
jgi:hypothetical protein